MGCGFVARITRELVAPKPAVLELTLRLSKGNKTFICASTKNVFFSLD
jgi:hypothetical protein